MTQQATVPEVDPDRPQDDDPTPGGAAPGLVAPVGGAGDEVGTRRLVSTAGRARERPDGRRAISAERRGRVPRSVLEWYERGRRTRSELADAGMATAEYAIATLAAVGFAGLLVVILKGNEVKGLLLGIIRQALSL